MRWKVGELRQLVAGMSLVATLVASAQNLAASLCSQAGTSGHPVADQPHDGEVSREAIRIPTPKSPSDFGEHHRVNAGPARWSFTTSQPSVTLTPARV